MSGPQFFQTGMGQKFFGRDVPKLIQVLGRIADSLERETPEYGETLRMFVAEFHNNDNSKDLRSFRDVVRERHPELFEGLEKG